MRGLGLFPAAGGGGPALAMAAPGGATISPLILTATRVAFKSLQGHSFFGLDVSLSRTGLCVLDSAGALSHLTVVTPPRGAPRGSLLCSGAAVSTALRSAASAFPNAAAVCVEDFAHAFAANSSSSHTRFSLARINGVAAFEAWRATGAPVLFSSAAAMRAYFGVARPGGGPAAAAGDAAASARRRRASGAAGKAAVAAFVARQFPRESLLRTAAPGGGDAADATLAAMHALAQEVEWRALTYGGGAPFWALAEAAAAARLTPSRAVALLPAWRGGGQQPPVAPLLAALGALHARELAEGRARRVRFGDAAAGGGGGGGGEEGPGGSGGERAALAAPAKRKKRAPKDAEKASEGGGGRARSPRPRWRGFTRGCAQHSQRRCGRR